MKFFEVVDARHIRIVPTDVASHAAAFKSALKTALKCLSSSRCSKVYLVGRKTHGHKRYLRLPADCTGMGVATVAAALEAAYGDDAPTGFYLFGEFAPVELKFTHTCEERSE